MMPSLLVALHNDREQYKVVLEKKAEDLILDRHEANGELFSAFFERPGVRAMFLKYLSDSYDEFCSDSYDEFCAKDAS